MVSEKKGILLLISTYGDFEYGGTLRVSREKLTAFAEVVVVVVEVGGSVVVVVVVVVSCVVVCSVVEIVAVEVVTIVVAVVFDETVILEELSEVLLFLSISNVQEDSSITALNKRDTIFILFFIISPRCFLII